MTLDEGTYARLHVAVCQLTPTDIAAGRHWYPDAIATVRFLADKYDLPYEQVACAAAALSPGLRWTATIETLRLLLDALEDGATEMPRGTGHLTFGYRGRAKAWAILRGEHEDPQVACTGPKVSAFAANLLGDLSRVAVDRHVVTAATGRTERLRQVSPAQSRLLEGAVALLAATHGLKPAELQAALWHRAQRP